MPSLRELSFGGILAITAAVIYRIMVIFAEKRGNYLHWLGSGWHLTGGMLIIAIAVWLLWALYLFICAF